MRLPALARAGSCGCEVDRDSVVSHLRPHLQFFLHFSHLGAVLLFRHTPTTDKAFDGKVVYKAINFADITAINDLILMF